MKNRVGTVLGLRLKASSSNPGSAMKMALSGLQFPQMLKGPSIKASMRMSEPCGFVAKLTFAACFIAIYLQGAVSGGAVAQGSPHGIPSCFLSEDSPLLVFCLSRFCFCLVHVLERNGYWDPHFTPCAQLHFLVTPYFSQDLCLYLDRIDNLPSVCRSRPLHTWPLGCRFPPCSW